MPRRISNNQYTANNMALWKPTRRTILRAGGLIAAPAIIGRAMAQVPLTGAGRGAPTVAASTTTFDPANATPGLTFSGSNLVVTQANINGWCSVRSLASHSSGTYYAEFTSTIQSSTDMMVGVCNASKTFASGQFLGIDANSCGMENNGSIVGGGGGTGISFAQGDIVSMEYNAATGNARWRVNGGSFTTSISTGLGGQTVFAAVAPFTQNNVFTANFGGSAYAFTSTAGNW